MLITNNEPIDENFYEVSFASTGSGQDDPKNEKSQGQPPTVNLPWLLKKVIEVFKDGKERKLAMYSTIVSLSGIFTRVSGSYKQKTCFPNMGFMALAPPASSKSVMMYPKTLIQPIQQYFLKASQEELKAYMRLPKKGPSARGNPPPYKVVFIPANISSSKFLQHLSDNSPDTPAIIIESEMDTLSITNASDYGNYSDIMRKALENEPVSLSRRMNNEYIDVECPKVAIILSGTPGQVFKFIHNREDGLLSRFLVMSYNNNQGWQSVSPCPDCINLTDYFRELSADYFSMWEFNSKADLKVTLSSQQWSRLNSYCDEKYSEITIAHHQDATSIIKRHGNMIFKICMVLTAMRKYEAQLFVASLECLDEDFYTALYLVNESLYSALELYEVLPDVKSPNLNNKEALYNALPEQFSRGEALLIGNKINVSERSVDRYLDEYVLKGLLVKIVKGKYFKPGKN